MPESRLILDRKTYTSLSTIGELFLDRVKECVTLEDTCRAKGVKVYGKTAIQQGTYEIILRVSPRLGNRYGYQELPTLLNVPNFEGVLIHPFNRPTETLGCIGVGVTFGPDCIVQSRKAFDILMPKIQKILKNEKLFITIYGGR